MDEILVHITAPTTRQNDELYSALAASYRGFQPVSKVRLGHRNGKLSSQPGTNPPAGDGDTSGDKPAHPLLTSKDSFGSFPTYHSSERASDFLNGFVGNDDVFQSSQEQLPTSSGRLAQLERIQRVWKKNNTPRSHQARTPLSSARFRAETLPDDTFIEDSQLAAQVVQSQLEDDFSSDDDFEPDFQSTMRPPAGIPSDTFSALDATEVSFDTTPKVQRRPTRAPSLSSPVLDPSEVSFRTTPKPPRPSSAAIPQNDHSIPTEIVDSTPLLDFTKLPIEVFAPRPKITIETHNGLPSQMTPYLLSVRQQRPDHFRPNTVSRRLQADERGHWLIDTRSWSKTAQYEFWSSLCTHVTRGDLGWGVFLYRDLAELDGQASLGTVQLYCWGEIVGEMWLVLEACSKGRLRGFSSEWVDAEEKTVIKMT
ncbi:hypothetical protein M011DRAFT_396387 [Sporormia fimetaria CBS 119925]|uniref:Uncharacterized protein n=1 Tax=Sporormia fimetaria CBS 119925 TaxID=1340428 RepID=A0A6A6VN33_9PLEO|nr:hypothetical protein M011DRAFT_396387 [Sporormia fimetaria CBS 119925]